MNLMNLENMSKSYTGRLLFDHADFSLQEGEKVGVVGINGTGKSMLLKILAGKEDPDEGQLTKAGHVVLGYLPQHPAFNPEKTALECVLEGNVHEDNRWTIENEAKAMMNRLGVSDFDQPSGQLSGGQRKRLALISVLLSPADILLLDEPTNHLDHEMADWLEDYLKKRRGALIMVTHDRYFLDSVCNRIVEIDRGKIYQYQTNYSGFLERKAEREEIGESAERKRRSILRTELEWMKRGARARSTKQKARINRYEELKEQKGPETESRMELGSISTRMGRTTVELHHICKAYGDRKLINDFSYIFLKNDRTGFIGPNGCGKSTLMKIIAGLTCPDSGQVVVGQTVKIGYYAQEISSEKPSPDEGEAAALAYMDPEKRVIDYIRDTAEYVRTADGLVSASAMLERFLFSPEKQYGLIGKLSGGEKRRLNLLRVIMTAPNVLVLDELTNDFDVQTLAILEDYLDTFEGIVIAVSHDRFFLDRTMRRIFAFEPDGTIRQYEGGYTDYVLRKEQESKPQEDSSEFSGAKKSSASKEKRLPVSGKEKTEKDRRSRDARKLKFTYKEQKDYETIEADMAALEEIIAGLEKEIEASASDYMRLNDLMEQKTEAESELEQKMERWMYLEELAEKIKNS